MYQTIQTHPNSAVIRSKQTLGLAPYTQEDSKTILTGHKLLSTVDVRPIEFSTRALENIYMALWRYFGGNTTPTEVPQFEAFCERFMRTRFTELFHDFQPEPFHEYVYRQFPDDTSKANRYLKNLHHCQSDLSRF